MKPNIKVLGALLLGSLLLLSGCATISNEAIPYNKAISKGIDNYHKGTVVPIIEILEKTWLKSIDEAYNASFRLSYQAYVANRAKPAGRRKALTDNESALTAGTITPAVYIAQRNLILTDAYFKAPAYGAFAMRYKLTLKEQEEHTALMIHAMVTARETVQKEVLRLKQESAKNANILKNMNDNITALLESAASVNTARSNIIKAWEEASGITIDINNLPSTLGELITPKTP